MMKTKHWPDGTYPQRSPGQTAAGGAQSRPTVAKMLLPKSLRGRLLLFVAVIVASVIGATVYLESRLFEHRATTELTRVARSSAFAVADDVELRWSQLDVPGIAETLHDFLEAVPAIRAISIVTLSDGRPSVLASTASAVGDATLDAGRRAVEANATLEFDDGALRTIATPLRDDRRQTIGAVVVSVSVAAIAQIREQSWTMALWLVPGAILLLTWMVDLLGIRLVHRPLAAIRGTMDRAARGDLAARAPLIRHDELGDVADRLNQMLDELQHFNVALQQRVNEATHELHERNTELIESHERVLGLREALARAERMAAVGHMAASVAHQVGTPLNLVSGYVQLMRQEQVGNERLESRLAIVAEQIDKITQELRRILDHARPPTARRAVRPAEIIERVAALARDRLDRQRVRLDLVLPDCPPIEVDVVQIELALLNLVTNSLDAMPDGGTLTLTAEASASVVRIEVRDTGHGIPPDLLPRLFEPWVTTKLRDRGTGLGLSIVRDVIRAHGGTIDIKSEPGSGTVILIELLASSAGEADSAA
jgi:signal transduction histidine kinase